MEQRNYKLTAALQQQTPMIHFQCRDSKATLDNRKKHLAKWSADSILGNPDIAGATLRATEVKPKLDRFVQDWCAKRGWKIPCDWKTPAVTGRAPALRYRMRLRAEGKNSPEVREPYRNLFFGNTGKDTGGEYVFEIFQSGPISLQLYCFQNTRLFGGQPKPEVSKLPQGFPENPTLLELLAYVLPAFFAGHCFGMRSSKGFGSFRCTDVNGKRQPDLDNAYLRQFYGTFYYIDGLNPQTPKNTFDIIWVVSGMMKSGFNFTYKNPSDYYKGRLFRYFTERGIGSDKAFIKQNVLPAPPGRCLDRNDKESEENRRNSRYAYSGFVFSRAMLGLAPTYAFRSGPSTQRRGTVAVENGQIKRFQSPVQFCAQGSRLYLMLREIPDKMFGAEFQFNNVPIFTPTKPTPLAPPKKTDFDLISYLDYFMGQFNAKDQPNPKGEIRITDFHNPAFLSIRSLTMQKFAPNAEGGAPRA